MCDKCAALDKKVDHYEQMLISIGDRVMVERLQAMIADLQAQKSPFILSKSSKAASAGGLFHFHVLNRADLDAGLPDTAPLRGLR